MHHHFVFTRRVSHLVCLTQLNSAFVATSKEILYDRFYVFKASKTTLVGPFNEHLPPHTNSKPSIVKPPGNFSHGLTH